MLLAVCVIIFSVVNVNTLSVAEDTGKPVLNGPANLPEKEIYENLIDAVKRVYETEKRLKLNEKLCDRNVAEVMTKLRETEERLRTNEKRYEKRLTEMVDLVYDIGEKLKSSDRDLVTIKKRLESTENLYEMKLSQIEAKLKSMDSIDENKLFEIENLKHASEHYEKKLSEFEIKHFRTIKRLKPSTTLNDMKLNGVIMRLFETGTRPKQTKKLAGTEKISKIFDGNRSSGDEPNEKHMNDLSIKRDIPTDQINVKLNTDEEHRRDETPMNECVQVTETEVNQRIRATSGTSRIAFTAYLSHHATNLGLEHTIPFDRVELNEGNAYDTLLHVFNCQVNGIYMFQSALTTLYRGKMELEIVKNGGRFISMYADSREGDGFDQGFNAGIIHCNKGDRVWVRVQGNKGTAVNGILQFSTFSGFLIWEM